MTTKKSTSIVKKAAILMAIFVIGVFTISAINTRKTIPEKNKKEIVSTSNSLKSSLINEGKCGEGKCGSDDSKSKKKAKNTKKCGDGKSSEKTKKVNKKADSKCGGNEKKEKTKKVKKTESKCGEGKCGVN